VSHQTTITEHVARAFVSHAAEAIDRASAASEPTAALAAIQAAETHLAVARREYVTQARGEGASWTAVGKALRISRQAARQTYGP
jgi:hypothetical protein